jgi:hypothetical protein
MGIARGLFLAAAGAATLVVACVMPWQDSANLDVSPPPQGDASITPTGGPGPEVSLASGLASLRAAGSPDADAPAPEIATLTPRTALASPPKGASLPTDRYMLARELQRELARVGCYDGEMHGVWTPTTRRAMNAFMDRINATLPTDEPDSILLTLVQGARDKVCGTTCPAGQALAEGRCLPSAILAGKKAPQITRVPPSQTGPGWSVTQAPTTATPAASADAGRMGLAGPNAPAQPPVVAAVPATSRPADAKRPRAQPGSFGLAIFKQFEKLGF